MFYDRAKAAWEYRKTVLAEKDLGSCRVIFGEADFLPGITIDKYEDVLGKRTESRTESRDKSAQMINGYSYK